MRIKIEMNPDLEEDEVIIKCKSLTPEVIALQQTLEKQSTVGSTFIFYKGESEYYLPIDSILFFETDNQCIMAHTADDAFEVRYKLYELEKLLPTNFVRISKSSIVNCKKVYSVNRNLTAGSCIDFLGTHKKIYVSRSYYKQFKEKMR